MIINKENLLVVFRGFNVLFQKAFEESSAPWQRLVTEVPSTTLEEQYGWLQQLPGMKEWIGDKNIESLATSEFTIKNRRWEDTIEVARDDIKDDRLGVYTPILAMLADAARDHPGELITDLILNGFANTCYDGQYFFDTDHPFGNSAGTWSNKGTAVFDSAGTAFAAGLLNLQTRKGEKGRYLNIGTSKPLLVIGPALLANAHVVLKNERKANGGTNEWYQAAEILVLPKLNDQSTYWALLDVSKPIKPFIHQVREAVHPVSVEQPDAESVFKRGKYLYGAEGRYAAGYGLPQLAYGSDGSV